MARILYKKASLCYHKSLIPNNLIPFFWDIDTQGFDPSAYPEYTIERILELGDPEAVSWMKATFSEEQIREVIHTDRRLSPKSATFWALIYDIAFQEVAALAPASF